MIRPGHAMNSLLKLRPLLAATLPLWFAGAAQANDFPTVDRVVYVQECMEAHPGLKFEMVNKCSCALDALAKELSYDDYVTLSTISKAISIGGERGGAIRDAPSFQPQVKRYRELQSKAESGCFLNAAAK